MEKYHLTAFAHQQQKPQFFKATMCEMLFPYNPGLASIHSIRKPNSMGTMAAVHWVSTAKRKSGFVQCWLYCRRNWKLVGYHQNPSYTSSHSSSSSHLFFPHSTPFFGEWDLLTFNIQGMVAVKTHICILIQLAVDLYIIVA